MVRARRRRRRAKVGPSDVHLIQPSAMFRSARNRSAWKTNRPRAVARITFMAGGAGAAAAGAGRLGAISPRSPPPSSSALHQRHPSAHRLQDVHAPRRSRGSDAQASPRSASVSASDSPSSDLASLVTGPPRDTGKQALWRRRRHQHQPQSTHHVITVEDRRGISTREKSAHEPARWRHPHEKTFAAALKASLREGSRRHRRR
jgi:hypothetical protein